MIRLWVIMICITFIGALISTVILLFGELSDLVILKVIGIVVVALVVITWILFVGALLGL